ncbi:MAG: patatin-like phospholipase family protein [Staphylococcus sp.]|nr:patatin-like phospholipase family protein [Staphylococcus sp.]
MRHHTILLLILALLSCGSVYAATSVTDSTAVVVTPEGFVTPGGGIGTPPRPDRQSVGLVLSGGGAKGIAHIGVIQAFEDNGIPIDYITGTSMGAIVGGLYAAGYSPAEMIELIASKGFAAWSTGKINPDYTYYFNSTHDTPSFVSINLGKDSTQITSVLPVSLINPIPMNYAFLEIFGAATVESGADFNKLFVPLRTVTSDVYAKHKVVLGRGSLSDAVRMSMSFPMIFEPILLNGVPMYDGGIYDNYPVDVMVDEFDPDVIIGINVGSGKSAPDSRNMMDQLEEMIMQPNDYPFPTDKGVNIRIDLDRFGLLAFDEYQEIYDIGYRHALDAIAAIKEKVHVRVNKEVVEAARSEFKARTPEVKINKVNVSGGTPTENAYLHSFFEHNHNAPLDIIQGRDAYYRAISTGKLQNFVPTPMYNERDSMITLDFQAIVRDPYTVGIGGYISSSTNSMLFFNAGYNTLSFKSIRANVNAWLGQSYLAAEGNFSLRFNTHNPTALTFNVVTFRQKYHETEKLFYQIHQPDFIRKSETFVRATYMTAPTLRSEINIGVGYGHLTDKYHADLFDTSISEEHDKGIFNLGQIFGSWEKNSLDNQYNPTSGSDLAAKITAVAGRYHYYPSFSEELRRKTNVSWIQADLSATNFFELHRRFSLGITGEALLSTRKLLPTYDASIVAAEAFHPTPSSYNYFNPELRANSFLTAGLMPVWKISGSFQLRGSFHCFLPLRKIGYAYVTDDSSPSPSGIRPQYGKWFHDPEFFGELQAVVALPFGSISAYGNYTSSHDNNWNFGISIGAYILAPKFLK